MPAVTLVTMKTIRKIISAAAGVAAIVAGASLAATPANAATPVTATAVTALHARPDSGSHGNNWANDALTRTATVTLVGPDATAGMFDYTVIINDTGTAFALTGQASPGAAGTPIKGTPQAAVTGSMSGTFKASSDTPNAALVPGALTGAAVSSGSWAEQFFPAATTFDVTHSTDVFSYTYTDTKDCQKWVDASDNSDGSLAADGDITGVDNCSTTVAPVGNQSVTVGQAASIQVFGSTTGSDKSLTYAATGLPDGLSINTATGLVSGTPAADAASGTVNVTVTDFGGTAAGTSFGVTVHSAPTAPAPVVLSHGHAIHVSNTRENVSWSQSRPSWDKLTIVGPGPIDHHVGYVQVTGNSGLGVITGLEPAHTYTVTIQPQVTKGGANAGNSGKIVFVTTH